MQGRKLDLDLGFGPEKDLIILIQFQPIYSLLLSNSSVKYKLAIFYIFFYPFLSMKRNHEIKLGHPIKYLQIVIRNVEIFALVPSTKTCANAPVDFYGTH